MIHATTEADCGPVDPLKEMGHEGFPRLTPNQHKIFTKLASLGRSAGAYELFDLLRPEGVNAIPTVYRALKELEAKGIVRHLASTKSFVAMFNVVNETDQRVMLVCDQCRTVMPIDDAGIINALKENAKQAGFAVRSKHLELVGTCPKCLAKETL